MGGGTEQSRQRMLAAIPALWRFTVELTAASDNEVRLAEAGIAAAPATVGAAWLKQVSETFASVELPLPKAASHFYHRHSN